MYNNEINVNNKLSPPTANQAEQESPNYDSDISSSDDELIPIVEKTFTFNEKNILITILPAVNSNTINMQELAAGEYWFELSGIIMVVNFLN
ncbi:hypothetical protein RclHR1_01070014 [Rhizophagus clarus]|uniref:Uncharacterized protein n=1 Tax=Rhizophagus clarus TaxID=94130 RepID=A0A2Z6QGZ1_9GLOM|nr:hypothetical protein RclHR1_01070014 [Rhizophagus clarus]GET04828.1 hypothetical protein RCL_jg4771.t1 [Rhizophagus clarus]